MKTKIPKISIDGTSIMESVRGIIDYAKYRKYSKEGFTTVIEINEENNTVRIRHGILNDSLLTIKGVSDKILVNKVYMMPTKKLVTKCVFVKEDCPTTIDLNVPYNAKQAKLLLNKFAQIKLLDEFNTFNMGQVLLGLLAGIIVGSLGFIVLQMMGGIMVA
jgi:hypothetical protein